MLGVRESVEEVPVSRGVEGRIAGRKDRVLQKIEGANRKQVGLACGIRTGKVHK